MMETVSKHTPTTISRAGWPANDNPCTPLSMGRSSFPEDAVARIWKPALSPMTSAKARPKGWRLSFERRRAPFIEPLMEWTGSDDMMSEVELKFPTVDTAIRYAERQGLPYALET